MTAWTVRPVRTDEFDPWTRLYRGYAAFYNCPTSDDTSARSGVGSTTNAASRRAAGARTPARVGASVQALFAEIDRLAQERSRPVVRWTTADDNYTARSVYDRHAQRTTWITYDMAAGATEDTAP